MGTWTFISANRRFLAFGVLMSLFASFGQTYYIAMFSAEIRGVFDLSHGDFGEIYAYATLASGTTLIWLGRKIDHIDLRIYSVAVSAGLVAACLMMSQVSSVIMLGLAIFTLRLFGQGLMSHTAATSMARYFHERRGMAIGLATTGHAAGEALFPYMAVTLIAAIGWRETWIAVAAVLALITVPLILWSLKGHAARHRRHLDHMAALHDAAVSAAPQWTRRDMLGDSRFYLILPAVLAPSFILTGLFFHQVHLVASKGWSLTWFAAGFVVYAGATVAGSLGVGSFIDRVSATRLMRFHQLPLVAGLIVLAAFDAPPIMFIYLFLAGISTGANFTVVGAVWAELYGVAHLGAIRALTSALMVFSTALAPVVMGRMIDAGVSMEAIAVLSAIYAVVGMGLVAVAFRHRKAAP
ncbi:MAG: MFS transporter [Proteobacteria bacterium]|nr:MFS transporter [Pseudomonadota bacterium]